MKSSGSFSLSCTSSLGAEGYCSYACSFIFCNRPSNLSPLNSFWVGSLAKLMYRSSVKVRAIGPFGGQVMFSMRIGMIGLWSLAARLTSLRHIGDSAYFVVTQQTTTFLKGNNLYFRIHATPKTLSWLQISYTLKWVSWLLTSAPEQKNPQIKGLNSYVVRQGLGITHIG